MSKRTTVAIALGLFSIACAAGAFNQTSRPSVKVVKEQAELGDERIKGIVADVGTGERAPNVLVVLQCECLQESRETTTNANGLFTFRDLPPGSYTVQFLAGSADSMVVIDLVKGEVASVRASVDPDAEPIIVT
ncbi:MAG: carboxypeptidase-like regulatory domain-containing protein [Myxococcota bacterium]